mgnify:CR=1 FL=1
MAQDTTYIRQYFEGIRDERGLHKNTATRIGTAFLLLLDDLELLAGEYLSRTGDDTAQGVITFLRGLLLGDGSYGIGADGLARLRSAIFTEKVTTEALEVNGWARFEKLVYNMLQLQEQDLLLSGGGDIERVVDNGDGTYTLHIHKEKEGRHTSFTDYDILMGKVDELQESGLYYTSWMRVCENGVTLNSGMTADTVRVELWDDNMVPGEQNFPPTAMMIVARCGNTRDAERQSFWEISTTDHNITHYWHVDQPVLRADNYALCLGILPTLLDDAGILPSTRDPEMPSLYVNTIFYEHAHHIYYPSRIVKEDRGEWTSNPTAVYTGVSGTYDGVSYVQGQTISEPYHFESFSRNMWLTHRLSPAHANLTDAQLLQKMQVEWHVDKETSRVWHHGALWECLVEGTTEEPGLSDDWTMVSGLKMRLDFTFDRGTLVWIDDVHLLAEARILVGTDDVTEDYLENVAAGTLDIVWTWQRMSYEDGTQTAADELWQPTTESGSPNILVIDHKLADASRRQDCGPLWEQQLRVWYRCTAHLSTGQTAEGELGLG